MAAHAPKLAPAMAHGGTRFVPSRSTIACGARLNQVTLWKTSIAKARAWSTSATGEASHAWKLA